MKLIVGVGVELVFLKFPPDWLKSPPIFTIDEDVFPAISKVPEVEIPPLAFNVTTPAPV